MAERSLSEEQWMAILSCITFTDNNAGSNSLVKDAEIARNWITSQEWDDE